MKTINASILEKNHKFFMECARIHINEIPGGFLPTLGARFLSKLYEVIAKSKHSFLILAEENSKVVGFIAISIHTKRFYINFFWLDSYKTLRYIPLSKIGTSIFKKMIETLKYPFSQEKSQKNDYISDSEIFNFCVDSSLQGRGVGQLLFNNAINKLKEFKVQKIKIVTGSLQNKAQKFYLKSGARFVYKTSIHKGEESIVYEYLI